MPALKQKVLFVEPRVEMQAIYRAVIKPELQGWDLLFASDGSEAIVQNTADPVDILIASEQLPGHDGMAVLETFQRRSPGTIRILIVLSSDAEKYQSMVGPAQQVMMAPLNPVLFAEQLNKALILRKLVNNPQIFKLIGDSHSLPPLPRVFAQLNATLSSPDANLNDVADLISQDVVLSTKVLRTVNSALFNLLSRVENLTQAVSLLGTSTLRSIVFAQGVSDAFCRGAEDELFFERLNRHSIACAKTVEKILFEWGACRLMIDQAIFCCFAHDLGKIILSRYAPDRWEEALCRISEGEDSDICLERAVIGIGHSEIAAYILAFWGFSNDQVFAVAFHHDPQLSHQYDQGILCALHIAEQTLPANFQGGDLDRVWLARCGLAEPDIAECRKIGEHIIARDKSASER